MAKTNKKLEFHELLCTILPPQTQESRDRLVAHIKRTGEILDPIIVWKGTSYIVDGHCRYTVAEEEGLPFPMKELEFGSLEEVVAWMREHQTTRREMEPDVSLYHMALAHAYYQEDAEKNGQTGNEKSPTKKTAALYGVSSKTVKKAAQHAKAVDSLAPDVASDYLAGVLPGSVPAIKQLAAMPKPQQKKAAKLVKDGIAKNLGTAMKAVTPKGVGGGSKPGKGGSVSATTDVDLQKSFDSFRRLIYFLPPPILKKAAPHIKGIEAIFKMKGLEL